MSATTSTKVEDNNLPNPSACVSCHKDAVPSIKQPRVTNLAKFSHKQHLKFGNIIAPTLAKAIGDKTYFSDPGDMRRHLATKNPCAACHRGLEESSVVTNAAFPHMADCLVCHNKIDPPFSCETCHAADAKLKPANHTGDFLDQHTKSNAIPDKTGCAICHGRTFTCLGCHQAR